MKTGLRLLLVVIPLLVLSAAAYFYFTAPVPVPSAWDFVKTPPAHVDHSDLITDKFESGREVTAVCLSSAVSGSCMVTFRQWS